MAADTHRALGAVKTARAVRYLDQIVSHFGRRCPVERDGNRAIVRFEGGSLTATAGAEALALEITTQDGAPLERFKDVVTSHLERWGVRDALLVEWEASLPAQV